MKHTPGPWKAESYICHAPTTIRSATGIVVAECSGHGRHTDESLSDARQRTIRNSAGGGM